MMWRQRVMEAGVVVSLAILAFGCNALSAFEGTCTADSDCDIPTERCHIRSGLCITRPKPSACTTNCPKPPDPPDPASCIPNQTLDPCGVGATCKDVSGKSVCVVHDLRVGVMVDAAQGSASTLDEYERLINEHVVQNFNLPPMFPNQKKPWVVDFSYVVPDQTDTARRQEIRKLLEEEDVDILITYDSLTYRDAKELAAKRKTLILGMENAHQDVVEEEQALEAKWAQEDGVKMRDPLPALPDFATLQNNLLFYNKDRYDFSLLPLPVNDAQAVVTYAKENLGCTSISVLLDEKTADSAPYDILLGQEAKLQGLCSPLVLTLPSGPPSADGYAPSLERLGQRNQPGQCIWIPVKDQAGVVEFFKAWGERRTDPAFKLIVHQSKASVQDLHFINAGNLRKQITFYRYTPEEELLEAQKDRFLQQYKANDFDMCGFGSVCDMFSMEEVEADVLGLVGRRLDLVMWAVLTAYSAQATHGPVLSPEQLRDASLRLLTPAAPACNSLTYKDCFSKLKVGENVHYQGLTTPMFLGLHGRVDRTLAQMVFSAFSDSERDPPSEENLVSKRGISLSQLQEQRVTTPRVASPSPACPEP